MIVEINLRAVKKVMPFASTDKTRLIMNGVCIYDVKKDDKVWRVYEATDGRVLARVMQEIGIVEIEHKFVLYNEDLKKVNKDYFMLHCNVDVSKDMKNVIIFDECLVRCIEGVYPKTEEIMEYLEDFSGKYQKIDSFVYFHSDYVDKMEKFFCEKKGKYLDERKASEIFYGGLEKEKGCSPKLFQDVKNKMYVMIMPQRP